MRGWLGLIGNLHVFGYLVTVACMGFWLCNGLFGCVLGSLVVYLGIWLRAWVFGCLFGSVFGYSGCIFGHLAAYLVIWLSSWLPI